MRSYLLSQYVQALHLRKDAPMPSEVRETHDRINALRACAHRPQGAKILQFERNRPER